MTNRAESIQVTLKPRGEQFWRHKLRRAMVDMTKRTLAKNWASYFANRTLVYRNGTEERNKTEVMRRQRERHLKRSGMRMFRNLCKLSNIDLLAIIGRRMACEERTRPVSEFFLKMFNRVVETKSHHKNKTILVYLASLSGKDIVDSMTRLYEQSLSFKDDNYKIAIRQVDTLTLVVLPLTSSLD